MLLNDEWRERNEWAKQDHQSRFIHSNSLSAQKNRIAFDNKQPLKMKEPHVTKQKKIQFYCVFKNIVVSLQPQMNGMAG